MPGRAALTSFQLSSLGSFAKLSGSLAAATHGPLTSCGLEPALLVAQVEDLRRIVQEQVPVGVDRELQVVLLDRAPDRARRPGSRASAGFLLKKIGGGSAFTPGVSFGMIWLRSTLASTRSRAMTRSSSGIALSISATTSRVCSLGRVGKVGLGDLPARRSLTSRSVARTPSCRPRPSGCRGPASSRPSLRTTPPRTRPARRCSIPARHLWLVHDDVPAARRGVGPWPAAVRRGRVGIGLCGRRRFGDGSRSGLRRSRLGRAGSSRLLGQERRGRRRQQG